MWHEKTGVNDKVVLRTYVEIRRNIKGFFFPNRLMKDDVREVFKSVSEAGRKAGMEFSSVNELTSNSAEFFCREGYLLPKEINPNSHLAILSGKDDEVFARINDGDHINVLSRTLGDGIRKAYSKADSLAAALESNLDIAFSEKLGFLTSDVKYVGTGMSISFIICIPGICKVKNGIVNVAERVKKYRWILVPSEDSEKTSMFKIVSNATLDTDEEKIITDGEAIADYINKYETKCRSLIYAKNEGKIEDKYCRAYALLRYARSLSDSEALELGSILRLGQEFVKDDEIKLSWDVINRIYFTTTNAFAGQMPINSDEADDSQPNRYRAEYIRNILKEVH